MSKLTSVLRQIAEGPTPQVNAVAPLSKTERIVADNTVSRLQAIQVALEHEIADEEPLAVDGEPPRLNDDLLLVEDEVGVDFVPAQSAVATEPLAADAQLDSC